MIDEPGPGSGFAVGRVGIGRRVVDGSGGKNEMTNVKNSPSPMIPNLLCITSLLVLKTRMNALILGK